jgi:hypothetical protein
MIKICDALASIRYAAVNSIAFCKAANGTHFLYGAIVGQSALAKG